MIRLLFTYASETILINMPDEKVWKLYTQGINEKGYDDCSLYLQIETEKAILVRDGYSWSEGRKIPGYYDLKVNVEIISEVHKEIISGKTDINIDDIEMKLINEVYEPLWRKKGYIEGDSW